MKTFTLFLSIAFLFAACEKTEIPVGSSPSDDDKTYKFDVITNEHNVDDGTDVEIVDGFISFFNESYPDSLWEVTMNKPATSSTGAVEYLKFTIPVEGYFDVAFTRTWIYGDYTDTIYGSGYFDADTAYFNYTYQKMEDGEVYGDVFTVEVHSL